MNGADAVYAGFADVVVAADKLPALRKALTEAPVNADARKCAPSSMALLRRTSLRPSPRSNRRSMPCSAMTLSRKSSPRWRIILPNSRRRPCRTILENSPTGLKLTLKLLRMARHSASLEECLTREYAAALEIFVNHDFPEGIRAAVIDKDRNPHWKPARIEEVTPDIIARYFVPRGADELTFPNHKTRAAHMTNIAFIGLGNMGGPMAANLVKAGHKVVGFDLVPKPRATQAKADGVSIARQGGRGGEGRRRRHHHAARRQACAVGMERYHSVHRERRADYRLLDHRRRKRQASPCAGRPARICLDRCAGVRRHRRRQGRDADLHGRRRRQGVRSGKADAGKRWARRSCIAARLAPARPPRSATT